MIHVVLGTKAQLIKMAPIMVRMKERDVPYSFVYTGQHRATMDEMLDEFGIKRPDVVLYDGPDIVALPQMFFWVIRILWKCLVSRGRIFGNDRRGIVLVHGDTFSTLLGALMGRVARLKVGHVESGLRSFNLFHPFPEELTRVLTFRLSHVLYCPGDWAMKNVARFRRKDRVNTLTNTMSDTLGMALKLERRRDHVPSEPFGLVSLHRYENIFKREVFEEMIVHLERIAKSMKLLFILHPPTEKQLHKFGFHGRLAANPQIELRPRYTYFDFASLIESAEFIITDGGSIQEESSYIGIPCMLFRRATERQEGLDGNVVLSNMEVAKIDAFIEGYATIRREPQFSQQCPSDMIIDSALTYC